MPIGASRNAAFPRSVGVLGSGYLAAAVTGRLLERLPAGTKVTAFGRDQQVLGNQLALGAARAASPADLAARSECVFVITDGAEEIERQLKGANGLPAACTAQRPRSSAPWCRPRACALCLTAWSARRPGDFD